MPSTLPKHFSLIREFHLADVLTLGNAASGVAAILFSLLYMESRSLAHFFAAAAFTPAALIFDWFDGLLLGLTATPKHPSPQCRSPEFRISHPPALTAAPSRA